jgi:nucleotide-binding universal stress UspA family protein
VRRILAAIDAAPEAPHVLARARDLARAFGAEVTVVRAFEPPTLGAASSAADLPGPAYVVDHLRRREEEDFQREVAAFSWGDVQHAHRFEAGDPAEVILSRLEHHDLLVMGTHGRTALSAALLGSVAQAVLRETHAPVLALRIPRRTYLI